MWNHIQYEIFISHVNFTVSSVKWTFHMWNHMVKFSEGYSKTNRFKLQLKPIGLTVAFRKLSRSCIPFPFCRLWLRAKCYLLCFFKLESYYRNHVMVMLLDYQQNDFQFGVSQNGNHIRNTDDPFPHITEIQDALVSFYIKLKASLARNRIRETALSVEDLLPKEKKEKNEYVCYQPFMHTWTL